MLKITFSQKINKNYKVRGFTLGLALVIVAATLLLSISISSILLRDLKNSSQNILNSIALHTAESGLECIVSYEDNIRFFDIIGNDITGLFPTSTTYAYRLAKDSNKITPSAGYAARDYTMSNLDNNNKLFDVDQIKCFGVKILETIETGNSITDLSTTTLTIANADSPSGYAGGALTEIKIKKDISVADAGNSFFEKYSKNVCLNLKVYSTSTSNIYKKLIISEASVPCNGKDVTKKILVRYLQ